MELTGKRVAILAENVYEDLELLYPLYRMREAGADVVVVGPQATTYTSKHGYPVQADRASSDISADAVDAVIIPGGFAPDRMRRDEKLVSFVREAFEQGKPVAAICHAGWMLAEADVCRGRRLTSVSAIRTDLRNAGAEWVNEEVVQDGNLITSRTPDDLPAFCRSIIAALQQGTPAEQRLAAAAT